MTWSSEPDASLIAVMRGWRGQLSHGGGKDVHRGAAGHVVDHERDVHRVRHRAEVGQESALGRLVVVGRGEHAPVDARRGGSAGERNGTLGDVGAGPGDHERAPLGLLERDAPDPLPLLVAQRRSLSGGAGRHETVHPLSEHEPDEIAQSVLVQLPVAERRHQSYGNPFEHRSLSL